MRVDSGETTRTKGAALLTLGGIDRPPLSGPC